MNKPRFEFLAKTFIRRAGREEIAQDEDHWFDTLNKVPLQDAPRRTLLRAAATLTGGLLFGDRQSTDAAKNRKRKRKRKRKKDKPQPKPQSCSGGVCAAVPEWSGDQNQINYCEFICQQCDGADERDFCIVRYARGPVAECCADSETCCGGNQCCSGYCCNLGAGRGSDCLVDSTACCPDDFASGFCDPAIQKCCPGYGCVYHSQDCPDDDCGEQCTELGLQCCHGACINTRINHDHCGGCDKPCTGFGMECCEGACFDVTKFDNAHCGSCLPCATGEDCCFGVCLDPLRFNCCRDRTGPYWTTCPVPEECSE